MGDPSSLSAPQYPTWMGLESNGVFCREIPTSERREAWRGRQTARQVTECAVGAVRVDAAKCHTVLMFRAQCLMCRGDIDWRRGKAGALASGRYSSHFITTKSHIRISDLADRLT